MHITGQQRTDLELLIDAYGLSTVLETVADICLDKAEHITANWQDETTAKVWEKAGTKIAIVADKMEI